MGKFNTFSKIIVFAIVFIVVMGGIIYHDVFNSGHSLNEIWQNKQGEIQFITIVSTVVLTLAFLQSGYFANTVKEIMSENKSLLVINNNLNKEILNLLKKNATEYGELMEDLAKNKADDLELAKRVDKHDTRLEKLEQIVFNK